MTPHRYVLFVDDDRDFLGPAAFFGGRGHAVLTAETAARRRSRCSRATPPTSSSST